VAESILKTKAYAHL